MSVSVIEIILLIFLVICAAATRYMIFSLIGSSLFLVGAVLLYSITGHLLFPEMKAAVAAIWESGTYRVPLLGIITLICVGLGIKGGMFPFYFWMPDTYGNALPGSASILSGLVCKGYILLMIRIIFCGIGTEVFYESQADIILFLFGAAGMIVGSLSAIKQSGINRMLAYSSAAQIGYVFLGIGISATAGMTAAIFQILAHAISKPLLFITAAQFREGCGGSKDFRDLQGVALKQRISGLGFTCGAMSLVGIPLFAGFVAKFELVKAGSFTRGKLMIVLLALGISTLLNVLYFLRTVMRVYSRPEKDIYTEHIKFTVRDYFPVLAMLAVNIYMGVHAQPILDIISRGLSLL